MISTSEKWTFLFLLSAVLCALPGSARAAEESMPPLVLERTLPLAGVSGRIDHMAIDLGRKRLFVAEIGNGTLDVVDLATGRAVHRISELEEPQGIGYAPAADTIAVASAEDGTVQLFRADDFSNVGTVDLGDDADNVRLDERSGRFVVGYGSGGLAVLDPVSRSVVSRTELAAHPEGFRLDPATPRAFVNLPDAHQIAVVDLVSGKQVATWNVPDLRANFPMALDETDAVLATVFRNPARLVLFDTSTGAMRENLATGGDADDVFFDPKRRRIYVSCGEGIVDVFQRYGDGYRRLEQIKTASGARTSLFVPELDRLFVAVPAGFFGFLSDAAILIFQPAP
jgi:hypothetical protein